MILVTGATGMFGGGVTRELAARGAPVRAMAHSEARAQELERPGVDPVVADMDDPATLGAAVEGVDTVFLVSPMDDRVQARERNVLEAAQAAGVRRIVKLHGAVRHHDALGRLHLASIDAIKASGLEWALLSPTSVMETSILSMVPWIENAGAIVASAGEGKVAHVAADDVARAGAVVLAERDENGRDNVITGPELLSLAEVAAILSRVTGREIPYDDVSDQDIENALVQYGGMTPEQAELRVICHYRAWREGQATALTDTYRELTGEAPTTVEQWVEERRDVFTQARDKAPSQ